MNDVNSIELRHLRHFVAVAEAGSYTAAAEVVHLTQSALSVSIRALERELGVSVFVRTTRGVRLSEAGVELLPRAKAILRALSDAVDDVRDTDGVIRGTLRVGIMHSLSLIDGTSLFREFHRRYPDVVIQPRAVAQGAASLIEELRRDELDVAFTWQEAIVADDLHSDILAHDSFVLVTATGEFLASDEDEVRLARLADLPFVEFPPGWAARGAIDRAFTAAALPRQIVAEVADVALCIDLVRAGLGVSILPSSYVTDLRGLTIHALPEIPNWTMSLVSPSREPRPAAAAFAALARAWHAPEGLSQTATVRGQANRPRIRSKP